MEAKFKELLNAYFDVPSISRFVLGRYWRASTDGERAEFTQLFEELVVQSYAARFSQYSGESFKIDKVVKDQPDPGDAIVHCQVQAAGQEPVRAEWRLKNNGGHYRIVDVKIEGVSMVQTFRDEFASVIRTNGGTVNGLNEALRKVPGPFALQVVGVVDADEESRSCGAVRTGGQELARSPERSARCRHCWLSTQATL